MNVCVIGDRETVTGFALAGVKEAHEVSNEREARDAFEKSEAKIVIMNEEFCKNIDAGERVLVRIAKDGEVSNAALAAIVRNALGFEIKV